MGVAIIVNEEGVIGMMEAEDESHTLFVCVSMLLDFSCFLHLSLFVPA